MKRKVLAFILMSVSAIVLFSCSSEDKSSNGDSESSEEIDIQIGSATQTGNFYPISATLSKIWNDEVDDVKTSSQATDGSTQNLNLMSEGKAKMGLSTLGDLFDAYNGEGKFEGRAYEDVRVLSRLYSDAAQVVVRKDSDVQSVDDLQGEKFVPGAPGSGAKELSKAVLSGYDMTFDDMDAQYVGYDEATDLMRNRQVEGAQVMSGIPTSAVIDMLSSADAELINLSDEAVDNITEEHPWLVDFTVPADTYDNLDEDIQTVAQPSTIVISKDVPDDVVYELTKVMWDNKEELHDAVSATENMKLENATEGFGDIPLHPGAEKYYEEEEVLEE